MNPLININSIILGDSSKILKKMESNSVDLVLTSPPYFQQRDYGTLGIGNENTEIAYLENLFDIFFECVRIIKPTGSIVFNLGDKYFNGGLSLLPYKFAIRAIESKQVFLINQLTWLKLNPTPHQDKRKLIQATEPFFIFAKNKEYYFNLDNYLYHLDNLNRNIKGQPSEKLGKQYFDLIEKSELNQLQKEQAKKSLQEAILAVHKGEIDSFRMKIKGVHKEAYGGMAGGRNTQVRNNGFTIIKLLGNKMKKDIIESPVEMTKENAHPAVYPLYIVQELIKLLSQENSIVLDPFCGSGTTCLAAKILKRQYLGIEINPEYVQLANERLANSNFNQELFL